jgi:threonine aldolase
MLSTAINPNVTDSYSKVSYFPTRVTSLQKRHAAFGESLGIPTEAFCPSSIELASLQLRYPTPKKYDFAGDNFGSVDPKFLSVLGYALTIPHMTYQKGGKLLEESQSVFHKAFAGTTDKPVVTFFCPTGTAAGRLAMTPVLRSIDAIVAADNAHLFNRECGSHFKLNSASVYNLPTKDGKLQPETFQHFLDNYEKRGYWSYPNNAKPKVISLSQPTEYGAIYSDDEVKAFAKLAHDNNMLLHMDGSRLFYVAGKTGKSLKALTTDLGVDMLFIGGSKNKMVMAEATVFTPNFFENAKGYSRHDTPENLLLELKSYAKQYGLNVGQAVGSAAQMAYAIESGYGVELTHKACRMADLLAKQLEALPNITLASPVETNVVLVKMPADVLAKLREAYELMVFTPDASKPNELAVRFMTNASTTSEQVEGLVTKIKLLLEDKPKSFLA